MNTIKMNESDFNLAIDRLLNREDDDYSQIDALVNEIIIKVKKDGDEALYEYTSKFDNCNLNNIRVTSEEIKEALDTVDNNFIEILRNSMENIKKFHANEDYCCILQLF